MWEVPNDGLTETINNPFVVLKGYFANIFLNIYESVYFQANQLANKPLNQIWSDTFQNLTG